MAQTTLARICLLCFLLGQSACHRAMSPECIRLDEAAKGIERIVGRDWRHTGRAVLEKEWPRVPNVAASEAGPPTGLGALTEHIGRLCETCDGCEGVGMDDDERGLRVIDLWICPRTLTGVRSALLALTRAAVGPERTANSVYKTEERVIEGYSWASSKDVFTLRADAISIDGGWIGNFMLGRCGMENVQDAWQAADNRTVYIRDADIEEGPNRVLRFTYVTICLIEDAPCRATELDGVWPTMRSLAERQRATQILVSAEDCSGRSISFDIQRSGDGQWKGGLWSPKRQ